jgi:hypothetical protein
MTFGTGGGTGVGVGVGVGAGTVPLPEEHVRVLPERDHEEHPGATMVRSAALALAAANSSARNNPGTFVNFFNA